MKKTLSLVLILMLCLPVAALAEGLDITQEAFYVTPLLSYHAGKVFCEVTNTTDKPMEITSGIYELFGADDSSIDSGAIYSFYPRILLPGEKGYFNVTASVKEAVTSDYIKEHSVAITSKDTSEAAIRYTVSNIQMGEKGSYSKSTVLSATVTNDTDSITGDIYLVFAAYNAGGKLLFCDVTMSMGIGLHPGSSVDMDLTIDKDVLSAIAANGDAITNIEAVAMAR